MNMLTGFSVHLCDVAQKPHRWQKPIVTTLLSERSNDVFKSYFTHLGQFFNRRDQQGAT